MSSESPRPLTRASAILRNVAANWVSFAVNALVTLALTPIVLHELGPARYGVWVLTSSVIGYYGMLDLGFRGGVTQFLTRYLAVGDYRGASQCMSSAVAALSTIGAIIVPLSLGMAWVAPHVFTLPPEIKDEAFWCILIVGCASALQFAFFPYSAIFTARQRFDLANLIGIGTRLLMAASIFTALKMGYGLVGVSLATCGSSAIDYLIRWRVSRRLVPELQVSRKLANWPRLREIASFGTWNFQISVSQYAEAHMQTLIIGLVMPIAAAGHYALATGLVSQIAGVLGPIGQVMYPAATELHARQEHARLRALFGDASRLMMLVAVTVVLIAGFWADDFYRLWIGPKFLSGTPFPSVAIILQILLLATIPGYASNIAGQILLATGRVRLLAMSLITGSVCNVLLVIALIRPFGLYGVAVASVTASLLVNVILIPNALQKSVDFPVRRILLAAITRPLIAGAIMLVLFPMVRMLGRAENWAELFSQGLLAGIAAAAAILTVGLTRQERERFLWSPARRIFARAAA
ncbi:MAG: polysaccharide biosynthesis C-terminal domain-containing protein [Gammaproteobacteria bacterium]